MMDDRTNSATMNTHEQTIDPAALNQPLTEFTVFPKLPPELRQKIFKDALPTGSRGYRMLRVLGTVIVPDRRKNSWAKKSKSMPKSKSKAYIEFTLLRNSNNDAVKELALSRSCTASRAVFLKRNPYTLRTEGQGLIRFAKDDIIYLVITPKLAIPTRAILDITTICRTHTRPFLEATNKIVARTDLMFLSKFEGIGVLGLVWNTSFNYGFEENSAGRFIDAALNSREEVHAFLKEALYWADGDLPEVHILNSEGGRVERSQ